VSRLGRRQPLLVGAGFAVLSLIVLLAVVMPKMSAVRSDQKKFDTAVQAGDQLTTQVAELEDAKAQAPTVQKQIASLKASIPNGAQLPKLIRQVQRAADAAAVDFVQVSPGTPSVTSTNYSTIPTQIGATGSYFAMTEFLYNLEHLPRAVKVTGITVGPGPDGLPQLTMSLTAEMYTADTNSGPGSQPGSQAGTTTGGA